jgi:hypothetical protein
MSTEQHTRTAPATAGDAVAQGAAPLRGRPRVGTLVLSLALLLMTAAYIAELRESSRLRAKVRAADPPASAATQPAAAAVAD